MTGYRLPYTGSRVDERGKWEKPAMALYKRMARNRGRVEGRIPSLQATAELLRRERVSVALQAPTRYTPPVTELRKLNTSRLLPARYSDSVLTRLADSPDELQLVYALDHATNERLLAEGNHVPGILARELASNVACARIINAAFAHPHPQGARFSTPYRGAWYAAFELATAKAEILFHRSVHFNEIAWTKPEQLDYDHYHADFAGPFHDLRSPAGARGFQTASDEAADKQDEPDPRAPFLDPGSYVASQGLAERLLRGGSLGVVFPSARKPGGTCLACFQPHAVVNVRKRDLHRLVWYPDAAPTFSRVVREAFPAKVITQPTNLLALPPQ